MKSSSVNWVKHGLVYVPDGTFTWSRSHSQTPIAEYKERDNVIRVYFSTRDSLGISLPTFVDLNAKNPKEVISISSKPIMELGAIGCFDDCGVMPSWIIDKGNEKWLYYIGWNVRNTIPYHNSIGLAISYDQGDTFTRFSQGPLWDRDWQDPFFSASSCVLFDEGIWKNWYLSCTGWFKVNGKQEPRYHIKYAESEDGINWIRKGIVAIDYKNEEEGGIVKASVIKKGNEYHMWYSFRQLLDYRTNTRASYRIGYATSHDGISWQRKDEDSGISVSQNGWDCEMQAYPHVISVDSHYLMFYNGNGFGKSGFGYASLEKKLL